MLIIDTCLRSDSLKLVEWASFHFYYPGVGNINCPGQLSPNPCNQAYETVRLKTAQLTLIMIMIDTSLHSDSLK